MNKVYRIFVTALAAAALSACVQEVDAPVPNERPERPDVPAIVESSFNVTRLAVTGANVNWVDNTEALVANDAQEGLQKLVASGSKSLNTVFSGELSNQATLYYIMYPAEMCSSFEEGKAHFSIPSEQTLGAQGEVLSMPSSALTALPKATMRNHAAAVTVDCPFNDVKSLTLKTVASEALTGSICADVFEGSVSVEQEDASAIVLKAAEGALYPGTISFVTLPGEISEGFVLEAESVDGQKVKTYFYGQFSLAAGKSLSLGGISRPLPQKESFKAEAVAATSSTLSFSWSPSNYTDAAADAASAYSFALYADSACSEPIVEFKSPAGLSAWGNKTPQFIFTGLEQNRSYWFKAVKDDYSIDDEFIATSNAVEGKTSGFDIIYAEDSGKAGDVILSEDFSELLWFGDGVGGSIGHINFPAYKDGNVLGSNPGQALGEGKTTDLVTFEGWGSEARLFREMAAAVAGTRLDKWGQINEGAAALVCMRPGYVKLGAERYCGHIVTPELGGIPEGKYADLKVSLKASRYESDPCNAIINVIRGSNGDNHDVSVESTSLGARFDIDSERGWKEYSVTVRGVANGSRLAIGMDRAKSGTTAGAAQLRMFLDEVKVEIVKINDNPTLSDPVVSVKSAFTDAVVSWPAVPYSKGYRVYLNGNLESETENNSVHLHGLEMGSEYTVRVVAYDSTQESETETAFVTKRVWQVKERNQGCRMATFQWDPLEADYGKIDINGNARLYEMVIYSDAACQNAVYTCYPYNGYSSTNTAFANSSWLGKKGGVNLVYNTKITFGSLKPTTTYWFRVRSLDQYTITYHATGSDKKMTNPAGTSDWSKPIEFTTPARHTLAANEVIYCGFDDFCLQMDYGNGCVGTTPATTSRNTYAGQVANGANHYSGKFCTYEFAIGGHQPDTWGFASGSKYIDGSQNPTPTQSCIKCNANAGDAAGWYMSPQTRPVMGAVMLDGDRRWVATPDIKSDLLKTDQTTACTLSFTYIGVSNSPSSFAQKLEIRQYNPSAIYDGKTYKVVGTVTLAPPYLEGAAATNTDFTFDYRGASASVDVDLYQGESLMIVNTTTGGVYRIVIDDIKVVKK